MRVGVARNFFGGNAEVDQIVEEAIATLAELGATIVDSTAYSEEFLAERTRISSLIFDSEFQPQIEAYLATLDGDYPKTHGSLKKPGESQIAIAIMRRGSREGNTFGKSIQLQSVVKYGLKESDHDLECYPNGHDFEPPLDNLQNGRMLPFFGLCNKALSSRFQHG